MGNFTAVFLCVTDQQPTQRAAQSKVSAIFGSYTPGKRVWHMKADPPCKENRSATCPICILLP